jgi:DNA (cytosine-5)-methyltransferase 1
MADFRFIDLFAGVGGFHLALETLGGECVLASEIDPKACTVYADNFPSTRLVGDIRDVTRDLDSVPEHEVLAAGFPCQPFSKSGFQQGVRDRIRGTLFFEIMEIIRVRHPRFVILENVRNLAGPKHRDTWRTIIASLREEGYRVAQEPVVFSPHLLAEKDGGAPQVRERVFVLAELVTPGLSLTSEPLLSNTPVGDWDPSHWSVDSILQADSEITRPSDYLLRADETRWIDAWQDFIEVVDEDPLPGFPVWVDAFVEVPKIEWDTPAWKANFLRKNSDLYMRHQHALDAWIERHGVADFPASRRKFEWQARGFERDLWKLVMHFRPSGIRVKGPTYLPALVAITQTSIVGTRRRRITPREAARLQGFPESYRLPATDSVAYKQMGNGVNVGAVQHVARALFDSSTLGWPQTQEALAS